MIATFTIMGETVGLNEYINAERTNRFMAAKIKKVEMGRIMQLLPDLKITHKIDITLSAFVKDKRKDPDNIYVMFLKFLLDAMVNMKIIPNDGQKQIGRIIFEPIQIGEPRFEITTNPSPVSEL